MLLLQGVQNLLHICYHVAPHVCSHKAIVIDDYIYIYIYITYNVVKPTMSKIDELGFN